MGARSRVAAALAGALTASLLLAGCGSDDDAPFAGFYTTGEIARVRGASGLHHLTMVTLALA